MSKVFFLWMFLGSLSALKREVLSMCVLDMGVPSLLSLRAILMSRCPGKVIPFSWFSGVVVGKFW